jgi:hypothetical protein
MSFADVRTILDQITFRDRRFRLLEKGDGYLLQVEYMEADVDRPENPMPVVQRGRKWYVSPFSTETEVVETAFKAIKTSMLHVTQEHFLYQGQRVYSPHINIRARLHICREQAFDSRIPLKNGIKSKPVRK